MEIILFLILISILWGNATSSSIISSIENIIFELKHGEGNQLLRDIKYAIPSDSFDYYHELRNLSDELKGLGDELKNIHDELQWHKSLTFASQTIEAQQEVVAKLEGIDETLKEMAGAQQEVVTKLEGIDGTLAQASLNYL